MELVLRGRVRISIVNLLREERKRREEATIVKLKLIGARKELLCKTIGCQKLSKISISQTYKP